MFTQGNPATCLYLLVAGTVELSVGREGGPGLVVETVTHQGYPIGWSAMVEPYVYRATATAREPTRLVAIGREALEHQARANPGFGMTLMRAVVGIVGDRLRATRTRLIARRYDDVVVAIRDLLDQSGPRLSVASPLHRLPYYLEHRLTLADAFQTLDALGRHGDRVERELAGLCADLLARARRELEFYQQLQAIYQSVAGAAPTAGPEQVRLQSTLALRRLFAGTSHRIEGWEHLPERPGHIFIMNHIGYHPDNVLPNNFVLTLDTHFVSSMVVFERYGEAPIRVVRKARPDEYGHQQFYDRLGYVYTYSGHVDAGDEDPQLPRGAPPLLPRRGRRPPRTGQEPGHLPGRGVDVHRAVPAAATTRAFRLAAHVRPEPLLVPVAVANFDKKLTTTTTATVVHEPFRLSDFLPDPGDEPALLDFINHRVGPWFRDWVREAAALANWAG